MAGIMHVGVMNEFERRWFSYCFPLWGRDIATGLQTIFD
jgi:hypothetical protein